METTNKRTSWIDVAKSIGMILVVIGHSNPPAFLLRVIASFHMPLFFFLSGLVYSTKRSFPKRIANDVRYILIPYIKTVLLLVLFHIINNLIGRSSYYDSLSSLFKAALFGSGTGYNNIKLIGEIWFLLALFWAKRILDGIITAPSIKYQTLLVVACVMASIVMAKSGTWLPTNIDIAFYAVGFLYAGYYLKDHLCIFDNVYVTILLFLMCVLYFNTTTLGMADRNYYKYWYISFGGSLAMILLFCTFCKQLDRIKPLGHFLSSLGRHSLLILCVTSMDWRMPFLRPGYAFIVRYNQQPWYWLLNATHRFIFDLIITMLILFIESRINQLLSRFTQNQRGKRI